ncbi:hypothetical protein AAG570_000796 [Ranatra chinensis]|uniref:Glycoside hydrolase family 38 N-terminal domain-containing protein n=1 Tax=Ranatra chinensis TaxID=642074 RepID=A0ABD0YY30_9HEMI
MRPETSWSIDPFGYSSTMPYLLSSSGVSGGLVLQRVHYAWKQYLGEHALLDLIWIQDFDEKSEIPLRIQHGRSYSVTSSCGPYYKVCPEFDFNYLGGNTSRINFSNLRKKAEVISFFYIYLYLTLNPLHPKIFS